MLINLEIVDDEIFIDIGLNKKELQSLIQGTLVADEEIIEDRVLHIGIFAQHLKDEG